MPTPSIQTLVTDAQQVLNLDSISAVRSVVAVALANANTGTPLNPNLTTQQLWNEFYQVVTKPKSDIESIIANQLMKFLFAPPAPGGVGANKQVIFNDGGVLAGDAGLTYDKATDSLTVLGSLGVGTSPTNKLTIGTGAYAAGTLSGTSSLYSTVAQGLVVLADGLFVGTRTGGDRFTLDTSGNVGIGVTPSAWISAVKGLQVGAYGAIGGSSSNFNVYGNLYSSAGGTAYLGNGYGTLFQMTNGQYVFYQAANNTSGAGALVTPSLIQAMTLDVSGNLNLGVGNLVPTNGKGIDFSATPQPAGMTSELLSDYEEGTWTPTVGDASSGGNQATTATAVGRYTKIGRLVTVQWEIADINTTGLTAGNAVYIRGLPFSSSSAATQFGTPAVSGVTFSGYLTVGVFNGSSFPIYSSSSGGSLADIKVSALASGTADIWGTLTYIV